MSELAVILTVHNRRIKTLKCLATIEEQKCMPNYDIIICDDGSTDGTVDEIKSRYTNVIIVTGNGNCYWTRGMHLAMKEAAKRKYKYYLMINDDVEFKSNMWAIMNSTLNGHKDSAVTGATYSKQEEKLSYSGAKFYHADGKTYVGDKIEPDGITNKECDVANWNCFLITNEILEKIGLIDPTYEHSFGDFDYSLRMRNEKMKILVSKEYVGFCENNPIQGTYRDGNLPIAVRIKKILSPTGLPYRSWSVFVKRYYRNNKYKNVCGPYIKFAISLICKTDC